VLSQFGLDNVLVLELEYDDDVIHTYIQPPIVTSLSSTEGSKTYGSSIYKYFPTDKERK
jgi:hypothetical protein